jgi:hypothetical protein
MKIIKYIIILLLGLFSCKEMNKKQTNNYYEIINCINCNDSQNDNIYKEYDITNIVELETNDLCLMNDIKQIEIIDSLIIILDLSENLYIFNKNGEFINRVGIKGNGPEEYLSLRSFFINDKEKAIYVFDNMKKMLLKYDLFGDYISSFKISNDSIDLIDQIVPFNERYLILYHMMGLDEDKNIYSLFDLKENKLNDKFFSYNPITTNGYFYSFSHHPISKSGSSSSINIILPLNDTIYNFSDFSFNIKYIIETPLKLASKNQIKRETPSINKDLYELSKKGYFTGYKAIFETEKNLLLEYLYEGLICGFFIFDKSKNEGSYYLYSSDLSTSEIPFFRIMGSTNDSFIGVATFNSLSQINVNFIKNDKLKNIINNMEEDSNPVLFFYDIK